MGRNGGPHLPKQRRCRCCGDFGEFVSFCSDECRLTGKDLMPEEILDLLAAREDARAARQLPRLRLEEEDILGWRKGGGVQTLPQQATHQGMGSIAVAALDYKRGGW